MHSRRKNFSKSDTFCHSLSQDEQYNSDEKKKSFKKRKKDGKNDGLVFSYEEKGIHRAWKDGRWIKKNELSGRWSAIVYNTLRQKVKHIEISV